MLTEVIIMLTDRQLMILQVIIDDFIDSAKPVGSRALSKKDALHYSAATIRNEMADLEELGFLEKTHTSSGRVPSEKGYRYYVDHLIGPEIHQHGLGIIEKLTNNGIYEFEQIVQTAAEALSELTNYTSIILGPEMYEATVKQIQVLALSDQSAVAILVTNTGHVEHRSFTLPKEISSSDIEKLVNILNDRLQGVALYRLPEVIQNEVASLLKKYLNGVGSSLNWIRALFTQEQAVKLYFGGKANILMQPEFNDVDRIRSFYSLMEREDEIINLLKNSNQGIKVSIGHENEVEEIKDLSLITASYHIGGGQMGTIALIGPTRMEYRKVLSLMQSISREMTGTMGKWYSDKS